MEPVNTISVPIRVRYSETDAMGFLHHGNYPTYFEQARTELFRVNGGDYRSMEEQGMFFVVVEMNIKFRKPARYDDVLDVHVALEKVSAAKLTHTYRVSRAGLLLTEGLTVLAMVDGQGQVQRIPERIEWLKG